MRRAFGKDGHGLMTCHGRAQVIDLIADAGAVFAANEDGVVDLAQPANQRPAFDTVIGDERAAGNARHYRNVDPAMVICRIEHVIAYAGARGGGGYAAGPADREQKQARPRRRFSNYPPEIMQQQA